jgi:DNA-binding sugar fermentation-stimulating protein
MSLILKLNDLIEGEVIKRPSKHIKTPYVADIKICSTSTMILGHTASLGCCGLADVGASVLMAPVINKNNMNNKNPEKLHCEYRVYLSIIREKGQEMIVGINPKLAEELTESALKNNLLSRLMNIKSYRKETKIYVPGLVDSRFDFTGIDENGVPFIMEVKNVPLADYEDVTAKDRKKMCFDGRCINSKIAYFPDGYRKKSTDTVSPRALKHINELALIKGMSKTRCIMCYVIQRTDVDRFQPSVIDPEYREAFKEAVKSGVEIITMVVQWTREGEAYFIKDNLFINEKEN